MTLRFPLLVAFFVVNLLPVSHAGLFEDLLARPGIQALLGRQPELKAMLQKCADANYKKKNQTLCQQADEASRLAGVPPDLRGLMASPVAAASLRELCLGVQFGPTRNTYLCTELVKADARFAVSMEEQRKNTAAGASATPNTDQQIGR